MKTSFVILNFIVLGVFLFLGMDLKSDFTLTDILGEKNEEVLNYNQHKEKYNDDNIIYAILVAPPGILLKNNELFTNRLLNVYGLKKVTSINRLQYINYEQNNRVSLRKFIQNHSLTKKGEKLLKEEPLFKKSYLAENEDATLNTLVVKKSISEEEQKLLIEDLLEIKSLIEQDQSLKVYFLGPKFASYYFDQELKKQQTFISFIGFILVVLFLFFVFRSLKVVAVGVYYIFAVFVLSGVVIFLFESKISPYTNFALFFIYVMAISDYIHFCSSYGQGKGSISNKIKESTKSVFKPCLLTTMTTAIAFLSLAFSPVQVISDFGIYSAIGISISFVLNFYLIPYFLLLFQIDLDIKKNPLLSMLENLYLVTYSKIKFVIAGLAMVILALFFVYLPKLNFDDNIYDKFTKDHPLTESVYVFNDKFNFTSSFDLVHKHNSEKFYTLDYENKMKKLYKELDSIENIVVTRGTYKYLNYIRSEMNMTEVDGFINNVYMENMFDTLLRRDFLDDNYNKDVQEERVSVYIKSLKSSSLSETISQVKKIINTSDLSFEVNGLAIVRLKILNSILDGILWNLIGTFCIIFIIFIFVFRSLKLAVFAMVPNLFPVIVVIFLLAYFQIAIEDSLILMLAAIIGISVDDTLHFMVNYQKYNDNFLIRLKKIMSKISFALISTTVLFIFVSPSYYISDLRLIHHMAIFFNIGLVTALICDYYLLPFLLEKFHSRESYEV